MTDYWFGLHAPTEAPAAWGARAIEDREGFSLLHDRQQGTGDKEVLRALGRKLNGGILRRAQKAWEKIQDETFWARYTTEGEHVLYEDDEIVMKGNTNGSCGYVYIVAYLKNTDTDTDTDGENR
jgi:hypothetical protein